MPVTAIWLLSLDSPVLLLHICSDSSNATPPPNVFKKFICASYWAVVPINPIYIGSKWKLTLPPFERSQTFICNTLKESWIHSWQVYEFSQYLSWDLHDKRYWSLEAHLIHRQGLMWAGCLWSHCGRTLEKDSGSGSPAPVVCPNHRASCLLLDVAGLSGHNKN